MRLITYLLLSAMIISPVALMAASLNKNTDANNNNNPNDRIGLHLDWLDKSVKPDQNFYKFANGNWQTMNPVPPEYSRWGTFFILEKQNEQLIKKILEEASQNPHNQPGSIEQKVGDFYYSGMDEAQIDKEGIKPLQPEFDRISGIKNLDELQKVITHLHMIGVDALFEFGQMQDFKDSTKVIGVASQGGLGLPDRDYYLNPDAKFNKIRQQYIDHIQKMFILLGDDPSKAAQQANTVMNIETELAKASLTRVQQRDPHAIYHPMDISQLQDQTPNFAWKQYFTDLGHSEITQINFAMPEFFKVMNTQLKTIPLEDWKTYLRWHLIDSYAAYLSKPFVDENFRMAQVLTGVNQLMPRWQRVVHATDFALGFAIGKIFVEKTFPPSSKEAVKEMIKNIRATLREDLKNLSWMTPATRMAAQKKLDLMGERVGYPDKWRDYSALQIDRGPYVLNVMRASEFLNKRELNKIGKPVDRTEWDMTPQTVNAYYDPSRNEINVPAGILQPPFFNPKAPPVVNYGAIGWIIGHEMTHGFDDQGAQFDGYGNLKNWWTPEDLQKFKAATQCIIDQFSQYTVNGNLHLQGKLVVGEATADLGGLTLSYRAFHNSGLYDSAQEAAGFTPDQQFFLGAAHIWASNVRPEEAARLVIVDPHPPAKYRVNGTFSNIPQFQKSYNIPDNSPMVNPNRCVIW